MVYILEKKNLSNILSQWMQAYSVYAPVKQANFTQFEPLNGENISDLDIFDTSSNTRIPPKALFLPMSETLMRYRKDGRVQSTAITHEKRIVFGMRPCDAQAIALLDTIFTNAEYNDPYWEAHRKNTLIIGLGCNEPCSTCFCNSVNSGPFSTKGMDAILTDAGENYLIETLSPRAEDLFQQLPVANEPQIAQGKAIQNQAIQAMPTPFETADVKAELDANFDSAFWEEISAACLGCGICTFLCPTCFCFDIVDEVQRSERVRNWDTCMFRVYSHETSGHNPRPTKRERTRQRIMHKFSYWLDHVQEIGCSGCGRCVRYCPVGIDIRAIVRKSGQLPVEVNHAG
jgi:sulfhydrogenase subunit beta (sulfur reductase)